LANVSLPDADETGFDALFIPGDQAGVDRLSRDQTAINFVRAFIERAKPVGAIDQGANLLVATKAMAGVGYRRVHHRRSAWKSWVAIEKNVATDRNLVQALISSRSSHSTRTLPAVALNKSPPPELACTRTDFSDHLTKRTIGDWKIRSGGARSL
jgi:putative intracellular protease/amidase